MLMPHPLQPELDALWREFHRTECLTSDPLGHISAALSPADFEIVSFITAGLSYGRVEQIKNSLDKLWITLSVLGLGQDGTGIRQWLVDKSGKTLSTDIHRVLKKWKHRFNDGADLAAVLVALKKVLANYSSLAELYASDVEGNPTQKLNSFALALRSSAPVEQQARVRWFSCAPSEGSTCKRLVMWLRWMLRSDEVDPGLWTQRKVTYSARLNLGPHLALVPLDTHVFRWAVERQIVTRKNPSWKSVEEVTNVLRQVDPTDPARFDFCICHAGMSRARRKN